MLYPTLREAVEACDLYGALEHIQAEEPLPGETKEEMLRLAAEGGCPEIAAEMVREEANINALDALGRSALHLAAAADRVYTIDTIMRHGGNPDFPRRDGFYPLHVAAQAGGYESVHALLHYGANLDGVTLTQAPEPAVLIATKAGKTDTIELFDGIGLVSTIFELVVYGDIDGVRRRLNENPDLVNEADGIREVPIHKAVRSGNLEVARMLLDFGARPNHNGVDGVTPIIIAALQDDGPMVDLLLERGADLNGADASFAKNRTLHAVVMKGSQAMLEKLLALGADPNGTNALGETPLHLAVADGLHAKLKVLMEAGADPAFRMNDGKTPLHVAVESQRIDMVTSLLELGAPVSERDLARRTPLHLAALAGNYEIANLLLAHGARTELEDQRGRSALAEAARLGHTSIVTLLLAHGAPVNERDLHGRTPLHHATAGNHNEIVVQLLDAGADVNELDEEGHGPLWTAFDVASMQSARLFAERGADMNVRDVQGRSLLYAAVQAESTAFALWLLDQGLSANDVDFGGRTPLHEAARYGSPPTARLLVERGAPIDATDPAGRTPMHLAAARGHILMVKELGELGARFDMPDQDGWYAIHHAAAHGHWGPIQYFILRGQPIDITTANGDTALHLSARAGYMRTASLLAGKSSDLLALNQDGMTPIMVAEASRPILGWEVSRTPDLADRELAMQITHNYLRLAMCEYVTELIGKADPDELRQLLELHPEFANYFFQGWTPLHRAVMNNSLPLVEVLLEFDADPLQKDEKGDLQSPLDLASRFESVEMVHALRQAAEKRTASASAK